MFHSLVSEEDGVSDAENEQKVENLLRWLGDDVEMMMMVELRSDEA